jgi:hypothetical protein
MVEKQARQSHSSECELNHSMMRHRAQNVITKGLKCHYEACDSKWHSAACGPKCELNHLIVRHRVQNGIMKHVPQNAILGHVVQNGN